MYGPKWPFSLRYRSRDTRHIDFLRVDGQSTDPRVLGRHMVCDNHFSISNKLLSYIIIEN